MSLKPRNKLREMIEKPGLINAPVCFDPLSARIAEELGYQAVYLGGYAVGAHLCITEPLITLTDMVSEAARVVNAVDIPVLVDADAGFGDAINIIRTIREFENVGVAGLHIEDQVFPKRAHYHRDYKEHIIGTDEMVEKIKIACESRRDNDFVIIGRTDAPRTHGVDEAVRRSEAYVKAGADMIMLFPNNLDETKMYPKVIKAPLVYCNSPGNRVGRPLLKVKDAEQMGYKMLSDSTTAIMAAVDSVYAAFKDLKETGELRMPQERAISIRKQIEDTIKLPIYYQIEERTTEKNTSMDS